MPANWLNLAVIAMFALAALKGAFWIHDFLLEILSK